jgi:hypothetical protein
MKMNKKYLIPLTLVFVATILMVPFASATTWAYVSSVTGSYGVSYSERVVSKDGSYAIFDGYDSKVTVYMTVQGPSGAAIQIYAKQFSGSPYVQCWSSPTGQAGTWQSAGSASIGSEGWYTIGYLQGNHQYIGIANSGGSLYVDQIRIQY